MNERTIVVPFELKCMDVSRAEITLYKAACEIFPSQHIYSLPTDTRLVLTMYSDGTAVLLCSPRDYRSNVPEYTTQTNYPFSWP